MLDMQLTQVISEASATFMEGVGKLQIQMDRLLLLETLKTEIKAMEAENQDRESRGLSLAHDAGAFYKMAERMRTI